MPTFTTYDGAELTCHVLGAGDPVVVLPGGPLRATSYLGNLGGLDASRELVMFELPRRRVDEIVADVEALREHLGAERLDILGHSAGASLAMLYAAEHPDRLRKLAVIAPSTRSVGLGLGLPSDDEFEAGLRRRAAEPWYESARAALDAWDAGDMSPATRAAAMPFFYGRWDEAAQAHATREADDFNPDDVAVYYAEGTPDQAQIAAAQKQVQAEVLVLYGGLDLGPMRPQAQAIAALFQTAEVVEQPGAGHCPWVDDADAFVATVSRFLAVP
jgi:pimeloyl-ACP methyl ester carboxylesterase